MSESGFLKIIIVALLLVNIGTLGYLWMGQGKDRGHTRMHQGPPGPPDGRFGPPPGPAGFLREELQLSDAQEADFRKLREAHHRTVMDIRGQMKESKRKLYSLMHAADTNTSGAATAEWLDSLAAQQRRIEWITYQHFEQVRAICTPKQQQKFDEVIGDALEQMR